jgi:hypothetical protein
MLDKHGGQGFTASSLFSTMLPYLNETQWKNHDPGFITQQVCKSTKKHMKSLMQQVLFTASSKSQNIPGNEIFCLYYIHFEV